MSSVFSHYSCLSIYFKGINPALDGRNAAADSKLVYHVHQQSQ